MTRPTIYRWQMIRELVWGNDSKEVGRKTYDSVSYLLSCATWKVILPIHNGKPFEWCHYYRDGQFVRTYRASDYPRRQRV